MLFQPIYAWCPKNGRKETSADEHETFFYFLTQENID